MPYLIQEKGLGRKIKINTCRFFFGLLLISHNDAAAAASALISICYFLLSLSVVLAKHPLRGRIDSGDMLKIATNQRTLRGRLKAVFCITFLSVNRDMENVRFDCLLV